MKTKLEQIVALFDEIHYLKLNIIGVDSISDEHADVLIEHLTAVRDELDHIDQEADDS